jgi:hypothetical protein
MGQIRALKRTAAFSEERAAVDVSGNPQLRFLRE